MKHIDKSLARQGMYIYIDIVIYDTEPKIDVIMPINLLLTILLITNIF